MDPCIIRAFSKIRKLEKIKIVFIIFTIIVFRYISFVPRFVPNVNRSIYECDKVFISYIAIIGCDDVLSSIKQITNWRIGVKFL